MQLIEWVDRQGLPKFVFFGNDVHSHWNNLYAFDNKLTVWLRTLDEPPTRSHQWLATGNHEMWKCRQLAAARLAQIRQWSDGADFLLNVQPQRSRPVVRVGSNGAERFGTVSVAAARLGLRRQSVLDRLAMGLDGFFDDDLNSAT